MDNFDYESLVQVAKDFHTASQEYKKQFNEVENRKLEIVSSVRSLTDDFADLVDQLEDDEQRWMLHDLNDFGDWLPSSYRC